MKKDLKDTSSICHSSRRRTLSIIDRNGKPIRQTKNPLKSPAPFPTSEYNSSFNRRVDSSKGSKMASTITDDVWTKESMAETMMAKRKAASDLMK